MVRLFQVGKCFLVSNNNSEVQVNMENSDYIYIDLGYSPIPSGCRRLLNEVTIKKDGKI